MSEKQYYIESDLVEIAGDDAIRRLGEKGNRIFLNLDKIGASADDEKNKYQQQYKEAMDYINEGEINTKDSTIILPSGGIVDWSYKELTEEQKRQIQYVTRKAGRTSELKRRGLNCEYPDFLNYGTDYFKAPFLEVTSPDSSKLRKIKDSTELEDLIWGEVEDCPDIINNQILRVNGNQFFQVRYETYKTGKGERFSLDEDKISIKNLLDRERGTEVDFRPRNINQELGLEQLLDKDIELHLIVGGSGSGKTVIAYAAAIESILGTEKQRNAGEIYEGILLFKSNDLIGGKEREEGFRPGSDFQKSFPFMKSYMDAHNLLKLNSEIGFMEMLQHPEMETEFPQREKGRGKIGQLYLPTRNPAIEIEQLKFARGRTFENRIIFVDETQNYTPFEMKQLIERVGQGSKIFLVGDHEQVDNPRLDRSFNGLTYVANALYGTHPRMSITILDQNYRSQSAELMRNKKAPQV